MMLWCSGVCCCWWPVEVVPTALPTGQVVGTLLGLVSGAERCSASLPHHTAQLRPGVCCTTHAETGGGHGTILIKESNVLEAFVL